MIYIQFKSTLNTKPTHKSFFFKSKVFVFIDISSFLSWYLSYSPSFMLITNRIINNSLKQIGVRLPQEHLKPSRAHYLPPREQRWLRVQIKERGTHQQADDLALSEYIHLYSTANIQVTSDRVFPEHCPNSDPSTKSIIGGNLAPTESE